MNRRKSVAYFILAIAFLTSLTNLPLERLYAAPKPEAHAKATAVVNVNKAAAEELQAIRGIGPALAERIIQYRDEHGPFKKVDDLTAVHGIGEAKLEKMKSQISI